MLLLFDYYDFLYTFLDKITTRYIIAILGSSGLGIIYGLKVNLHVAIVSMVNHTALEAGGDVGHGAKSSAESCAPESLSNDTSSSHAEVIYHCILN